MHWEWFTWIAGVIAIVFFFGKGCAERVLLAGVHLAGLLLAILWGWFVGRLAEWFFAGTFSWSPAFTGLAAGVFAGLCLYGLVAYLAMMIYEIIDDHFTLFSDNTGSLALRLVEILGGGVVEVIFGVILAWIGITLLVAAGNAAETQVQKSNLPPNWVEKDLIKVRDKIHGSAKKDLALPAAKSPTITPPTAQASPASAPASVPPSASK